MPVTNIAKVFAPTLVGYSCPHPEPVQMLTEAKIQPKVYYAPKLLNKYLGVQTLYKKCGMILRVV